MKDLKYYTCIYDSDNIDLYFLEESGSCSLVMKEFRTNFERFYEAIIATGDALTLTDYPSSDDELSLTERVSFLFGTQNGYIRFVRMCEKQGFEVKDITC